MYRNYISLLWKYRSQPASFCLAANYSDFCCAAQQVQKQNNVNLSSSGFFFNFPAASVQSCTHSILLCVHVVLLFCPWTICKETYFKGSYSGLENVIWRLAQHLDDAWKEMPDFLIGGIFLHRMLMSILAHKNETKTALILLESEENTISIGLVIWRLEVPSLFAVGDLSKGIITERFWRLVISWLYTIHNACGGEPLPAGRQLCSWPEVGEAEGFRRHLCCCMDTSCWCTMGSTDPVITDC